MKHARKPSRTCAKRCCSSEATSRVGTNTSARAASTGRATSACRIRSSSASLDDQGARSAHLASSGTAPSGTFRSRRKRSANAGPSTSTISSADSRPKHSSAARRASAPASWRCMRSRIARSWPRKRPHSA
eukprot:1603591-Pyramimonas_sp.AAC.2